MQGEVKKGNGRGIYKGDFVHRWGRKGKKLKKNKFSFRISNEATGTLNSIMCSCVDYE